MSEKIAATEEIQSCVVRPPRGLEQVPVPLPHRTLISNEIIETDLAIIALCANPILATPKRRSPGCEGSLTVRNSSRETVTSGGRCNHGGPRIWIRCV